MLNKSYIFAILIMAILVVTVMYFSQSDGPSKEEKEEQKQVVNEKTQQLDQMREMIEQNEMLRQKEHHMLMQELQHREHNRQQSFMEKMKEIEMNTNSPNTNSPNNPSPAKPNRTDSNPKNGEKDGPNESQKVKDMGEI